MSLKRNIVKVFDNQEPFWGRYKELNNARVPTLNEIQEYQLQKIEAFQKISEAKAQAKYANLNALFRSGDVNTLIGTTESDSEMALNIALTNIIKAINGTYAGNKSANKDYNYTLLQQQLLKLQQALMTVNSALKANGSQGIPSHYLDQLSTTLAACNLQSLDIRVLDNWFKHLSKYKGDLVEDLGVEWLTAQKIPNILTLNTGALNLQGEISGGRHRGQLIQDLMLLDITNVDLMKIPVTYKPIGSNNMITTTLQQLFKDMEVASGQSKQIIINDNTYNTLLELSALNIQAKSGLNQKPWNENSSTSVQIKEFDDKDGLTLSAKRTFELLHTLDQDNKPKKDIWVKDKSHDYNMLADYGLATILFKILHLEKQGNQYLLTPEGFTTYTKRIETLMRKRNSRIYIKGGVTINDNTLGTPYKVSMTNYN